METRNLIARRLPTMLPYLLFLVALIALVQRSLLGFSWVDESFYLALADRLHDGAAPFLDEWHPAQVYAPLLLPLYDLYLNMTGSADGILLFFRLMHVLLSFIVALFVYYSLGMTLERVWGTFKYNFFYFTGVILLVLAAILIYLVTGYSVQLYPTYMTFSIFLAYALTFPETTFLLYFIIPIKAKWLAIAEVVLYLFYFVALPGLGNKVAILVSLLNVALFFLLTNQRPKNRNIYNMRDFR